jgi:hypothetical protein
MKTRRSGSWEETSPSALREWETRSTSRDDPPERYTLSLLRRIGSRACRGRSATLRYRRQGRRSEYRLHTTPRTVDRRRLLEMLELSGPAWCTVPRFSFDDAEDLLDAGARRSKRSGSLRLLRPIARGTPLGLEGLCRLRRRRTDASPARPSETGSAPASCTSSQASSRTGAKALMPRQPLLRSQRGDRGEESRRGGVAWREPTPDSPAANSCEAAARCITAGPTGDHDMRTDSSPLRRWPTWRKVLAHA